MNIRSQSWSWQLGIACAIATGGAFFALENRADAQIVPDTTLGSENSKVSSTDAVDTIDGGGARGTNLFHSFVEFNVNQGRAAYFNQPVGIENIITRVTGANPSNILGTLGIAGGNANLFLINPNGIIFGPSSRLDVRGSFVGTTANAIGFGNSGVFSATNPSNPSLLTVNPNALLFNQIRAAKIENNSVADSGLNPSTQFTALGLRVPDGKSLLLVGGDINMDGGRLFAFAGRVELGGLATAGTVGLNGAGNNLSLSFPSGTERSDVSLSNGAVVDVTAGDAGSTAVNARNLEMTGKSRLRAGIASGLDDEQSKAGDIEISATGAINLNNGSRITNLVEPEANGQGGDINISASTLLLEGGTQVSAGTFGAGNGGSLSVNASEVQLIGTSADGQSSSGLYASAGRNSTGDGGDLTINTNTLLVRDGAQASASTFGAGNGGSLRVNASNVQLIGTSANGQTSTGLFASTVPNSTGDGGDLTINTNTLLVRDGAQIFTGTFGAGNSGSLRVDASNVQLIGTSADGQTLSVLGTSAQSNLSGDAGSLTINTNTLLVRDGAQINASTLGAGKGGSLTVNASDVQLIGESADGQFASALGASAEKNSTGDAGDLNIKTNTLLVRDGAQVFTGTFGAGKGGSLRVDASDVQLIGIRADNPSGLVASAEKNSTGDAGDLNIKTNTLLVRDGAQVNSATFGLGKGGSLTVDASDVQLIGTTPDGQFPSDLSASAQPNSTGDAGNLNIKTNTLLVRDGAGVFTSTYGAGKGGILKVDASNVQLIGKSANSKLSSALSASTERNSTGDAGDLTVNTDTLLVQDGATVSVQSDGTGTAGNMRLNARSLRLDNNGLLSANTQSALVDPNSEQATINIKSRDLVMRRGSNIRTNATGENVIGGNINIDTDFLIGLENSDISANSANFRGGNVRINASGIFGTQFRDVASDRTSDITATGASPELGGSVELNIPNIEPNSDLVNLPSVPVDTSVAQACSPSGSEQNSEFVVTGRGGLPQSPTEAFNTDAVEVDLVTLNPQLSPPTRASTHSIAVTPTPIVEANAIAIAANGQVILTANAQIIAPLSSMQQTANCQQLN